MSVIDLGDRKLARRAEHLSECMRILTPPIDTLERMGVARHDIVAALRGMAGMLEHDPEAPED